MTKTMMSRIPDARSDASAPCQAAENDRFRRPYRLISGLHAIMLLLTLSLLLAACSGGSEGGGNAPAATAENAAAETGLQPEQTAESSAGEQEAHAEYPRTVTDAGGEVTIESRPERVALVHWGLSDILLTFDLSSAGIALPFTEQQSVLHTEAYAPYVDGIEELAIVGENTAVNLEALLAYDPDLIIAGNATNADILDQLKGIATVYTVDEEKIDVWGDWKTVMRIFGSLLAQEEQAENYIADFEAKAAAVQAELAGLEGSVAFLQVRENTAWLQSEAMMSQYYGEFGLTAPENDVMQTGGELSLEGLTALNPDHLVLGYFNFSDPSIPAVTDGWEESAVWQGLGAVRDGHVHAINGELAFGFGPIGKAYGMEAVAAALKARQ